METKEFFGFGTDLDEGNDGRCEDGRDLFRLEEVLQKILEVVLRRVIPVQARNELGQSIRGAFAHMRCFVSERCLHGEDLDLQDVHDANGSEDSQCEGADVGVGIGQIPLEGVDREEGQVPTGGIVIGIMREVRIDHLSDFEGWAGYEFDDVGEEIGYVAALGHGCQQPFHGIEQRGEGVGVGGVCICLFELRPDGRRADGILEKLRIARDGQGRCEVFGEQCLGRFGDFGGVEGVHAVDVHGGHGDVGEGHGHGWEGYGVAVAAVVVMVVVGVVRMAALAGVWGSSAPWSVFTHCFLA